jgi:DNA-binding MarR family transcriptional regulator
MITTGGMTKRLDRLETAGLIVRRVDADDARVRRVALTDRGRAVIDAAFGDHMRNETRLLAELPASDRLALERILRDWLVRIEGAAPSTTG